MYSTSKILTISIAAYNVARFIRETLDSLKIDTKLMEKIEVIIVDDGSSDSTAKIANEYSEKFPNTFITVSKTNGGYGSTINCSLARANGKYFKLLDGDDWFNNDNLSGFIAYLESCNSDLVITPYFLVDAKSKTEKLVDDKENLPSKETKINEVDIKNDIVMHEIAVKTSILKNNISITNKCFYTDNEFTFFSIFLSSTISKFLKPIYCYRMGEVGQSVSLEGERKHYKDNIKVARHIYQFFSEKDGENLTGNKLQMINRKLLLATDNVYSAYMVKKHPSRYKHELVCFDQELLEKNRYVYNLSKEIPKIAVLRRLKFRFYPILCQIVTHNTIKGNANKYLT